MGNRIKFSGAIILTLFVLASISIPAQAGSPFANAVERRMYILAVGESGGKYFGVPTELRVVITNGTGMVYLSTEPLAEVDMQASARLAALVATYISGKDYFSYDYFISVKSNSTIIGGPSAGAAMTVAMISALLGKPLNDSVVETGMILPDGTIGPVGGIPEKLEAAAEVGAKVMLIPAGQRIAYSLAQGRYVDVVKLGEEKGIKVVEVSTIYDALHWFGIDIPRPPKAEVELGQEALSVIKSWINESIQQYKQIKSEAESEVLNAPQASALVKDFLGSARKLYVRGQNDLESGKYYSAASDLFAATINASTAYWIAAIASGSKTYDDLLNLAKEEVQKALDKYSEVKEDVLRSGDVAKLSIAVEVATRAMEANESLSELPATLYGPGAVYDAVYTVWRARTVLDWAKMYDAIPASGITVGREELNKYTALLVYFSRTSASYIESLVGQVGSVRDVLDMADKASAIAPDDPVAALALALRASGLSSAMLNTAFTTDLGETADRLRNVALEAAGEAIASGFDPTVALSYIERGDSLRGIDDATAVYFYDLALTNTMWYLIISGAKASQNMTSTMTTSTGTPTQQGTSTTTESSTQTPPASGISPADLVIAAAVIVGAALAGLAAGLASRRAPKT